MNFLIQTVNNKIVHDFCFGLVRSWEFAKWRNNPFFIFYCEIERVGDYMDCIPVGTVEFVENYYTAHFGNTKINKGFMPLNVPDCLIPYAGRNIWNVNANNAELVYNQCINETMYKKNLYKIKDQSNGFIKVKSINDILNSQISSNLEEHIVSEWRVFVYHDKVQHIANYSGDCLCFPNPYTIQNMVNTYKNSSPVAYTLDVFVNDIGDTYVMECHRFFSCGLYGFSDYSILPYMFSQEWHEILNL